MIIGKAQLGARILCLICMRECSYVCRTAAFLTQTVNLEDGTTVKFEIWYAAPTVSQMYVHMLTFAQGHCRSGALQG
jgi:hypothetical protein